MSGVAAIAFLAAFTSCSKSTDLYEEGRKEKDQAAQKGEEKKVTYEEAFTKRYGKIDSNNDWGFGSIGKSTTRSAVDGRANVYTDYHSFSTAPGAPAASVFKSAPAGMEETATVKASNGEFVIGASTKYVELWGTGSTIYVKGDCSPTEYFYVGGNTKIYILNGGKLNLGEFSFGQSGCEIYVADGGELNSTGQLQFSGTKLINNGTVNADKLDIVSQGTLASVYNCSNGVIKVTNNISMSGAGTYIVNDHNIEATSIGVTSGSLVYNNEGALLDLSGNLGIENNNCEVINKGTVNADRLHTAGSAHFVNEDTGIVVIDGDTDVDSNNNTWVNNGQYTTDNFTYQATSGEVINNCKLTVIDKFYIGLGQNASGNFKLDGSIITKDFELKGPANIKMTSNSVIKVSNEAKMNITLPEFGIYGPTSGDYAVFEAKNIVWGGKNNYCVNYFNKLYVVADSHFEHIYLGNPGENPSYTYDENVKMFVNGTDKPDYTIEESNCNPGFQGNKKKINYACRIICEDLGASDDFDFNDVVFDALIEDGKTYIKILAAGGTLPLTVGDDEHEVHAIFNVGTSTMVNTQPNAHYATQTDKQEYVINKAFASYKDIPVKVAIDASAMTPESYNELKAEKGSAPQKIAVNLNFYWCDEREQIEERYDFFTDYVQKANTRWGGGVNE